MCNIYREFDCAQGGGAAAISKSISSMQRTDLWKLRYIVVIIMVGVCAQKMPTV